MIKKKYRNYFQGVEDAYMNDENEFLFIDEILIRAFFYSKSNRLVHNFNDFLNHFIDPTLKTIKSDLIEYLKTEFGIV